MRKRVIGAIGVLVVTAALSTAYVYWLRPTSSDLHPGVIFHDGVILTMDDGRPQAQALAIRDDTLVAVGNDSDVLSLSGPATTVIDLGGKPLLPGFIDSHAHRIGDRDLVNQSTPDEPIQFALESGWTSINELFVNQERLDELRQLDQEGRLRVRVNAYLPINYQEQRFGTWYQSYQPGQVFSPRLRIGGVKLFADNDYDKYMWFTQDELNAVVVEAHHLGFQIAIHSMGNASLNMVLNAFENALQGESNVKYRHRIEHVVLVQDDQLERMRRLGMIASFQFTWFNSDSDWIDEIASYVGTDRIPLLARWHDLLESGVTSVGSTDYPWINGTDGSAIRAIDEVVTRMGEQGRIPPDWMLAQRIGVEQALRLLTINGAYSTFQEKVKGSITEGKLADIVVLSEDLRTIPTERLLETKVLMTMVGGRVEYCASGQEALCPPVKSGSRNQAIRPALEAFVGPFNVPIRMASASLEDIASSFSKAMSEDESSRNGAGAIVVRSRFVRQWESMLLRHDVAGPEQARSPL